MFAVYNFGRREFEVEINEFEYFKDISRAERKMIADKILEADNSEYSYEEIEEDFVSMYSDEIKEYLKENEYDKIKRHFLDEAYEAYEDSALFNHNAYAYNGVSRYDFI